MQGMQGLQGALAAGARPLRPLHIRPAPTHRRALIVCARPSQAAGDGEPRGISAGPTRRARRPAGDAPPAAGGPGPAQPYPDALLQREYELWQRQSGMYERLQEAYDRDLERFAQERAAWAAAEGALRQEAAELRAQLLYVMAQLGALQQGTAPAPPPSSSAASVVYAGSPALTGREPAAALPSSSSSSGGGLSPGEQVKAVVDAMRPAPGAPAPAPAPATASSTTSSTASSPVDPMAAWPAGADAELPPYAADLAAAVAAVDSGDVLSGVSGYSLQARHAAPAPAQSPAAPQAPAPPPPAPAAPQPSAAAAADDVARGSPPPLTLGANDIFWVSQLHTALVDMGYFPGDDDIDVFYFGEDTQSAVLTMQCCEGLEETGIVDEATWAKLLGPELRPRPSRDLTADLMINVPGLTKLGGGGSVDGAASSGSSGGASGSGGTAQPAYSELFSAAFTETVGPAPGGGVRDVAELTLTEQVVADGKVVSDSVQVTSEVAVAPGGDTAQVSTSVAAKHEEGYTAWPVLHEGDGGREVHALHIALERAGCYPSEDDIRWWTFSDGTLAALKTFQACNGYPESGVCDSSTWRLLLGPDAQPNDLLNLKSGESDDDDLADQTTDRVWLIGEQRWENRARITKRDS